jgi:stage V sporulation protein SpoVS
VSFNPLEKVELTVKSSTPVSQLAHAVTQTIMGNKTVKLVGIGAGAVNQATKAAAKANEKLAPVGKFLVWRIYFETRVGHRPEDVGGMISGIVLESMIL